MSNNPKMPWESKTLQGVVMMVVAWAVSRLNLPLGDEAIQEVATALLTLVGAGWTAYGRIKADRPVKIKKTSAGPLAALLLAVCLAGCAAVDRVSALDPPEQARVAAATLLDSYMATHMAYLDLHQAASPAEREHLETQVAPVLDEAKRLIVLGSRVSVVYSQVAAWRSEVAVAGDSGSDPPLLGEYVDRQRVRQLLDSAGQVLGRRFEVQAPGELMDTIAEASAGLYEAGLKALGQARQNMEEG
ncbi:hypothetical protein [Desulfohalovibrio reitneri]|uniref:hypothetical protein n=1 Tax=Desulfohalovibrio reitneri TaxID=1307759 RepID=UPI0004A76B7E|nr:hypothetical protein [Desulfohalovibrio reitneri]